MPRKAREGPGERLRRDVLDRYELGPHEVLLLDNAAATADLVADLQAVVEREGALVDGKAHPAAVEARLQRLALGRLLAALKIPVEDDERSGQPRRGARGFYSVRGGAA